MLLSFNPTTDVFKYIGKDYNNYMAFGAAESLSGAITAAER